MVTWSAYDQLYTMRKAAYKRWSLGIWYGYLKSLCNNLVVHGNLEGLQERDG